MSIDLLLALATLIAVIAGLQSRSSRARVRLLAEHLAPYDIERLMQTLSEGYLRALGENDAQRRGMIWQPLQTSEWALAEQVERLAADLSALPAEQTRVLRLPLRSLLEPLVRLTPVLQHRWGLDLRALMQLHARALRRACQAPGPSAARRAHTLMAEMLLLQHSCHWFCRSRALASARLLAHHQSSYEKVLASIDPLTRADYLRLIGRP